jgi:hypothetical protein
MVAPSRRILAALTLSCGLSSGILAVAQPGPATADVREGMQSAGMAPCVVGHRFEPGPIVAGHYRQPTRAEFEAQMQELKALSQRGAGSCAAPSHSTTADDMASGTRPTSPFSPPER